MAKRSPLADKVVLVTGAARGIGAEAARAIVARGGKVALLGLEAEKLRALAAELGDAASWSEADVTDAAAVARGVDEARSRWGGIDHVFSNAGIGAFGTIGTIDPGQFARVIDVNFFGTWNVMRAALPSLVERKGYFLANASLAAAAGIPGMAAYGASKAAAESLCDTLRQEVRHRGVDVGVCYFCWIDTDLVTTAETHPGFKYLRQNVPKLIRATSPVSLATAAVIDGLEKRRTRVVAPGKIRLLLGLRWPLALKLANDAPRLMPEVERMCAEEITRYGGAAGVPTTDPVKEGSARPRAAGAR